MKLLSYSDFIDRVEELGFMAFSNIVEGLPSLTGETPMEIWHTGDPETDPWRWKDRAAEEKRLAFGCVLGGNKGFIAPRLYPAFLAACSPSEQMEERRYSGLVSQTVWELWELFEERRVLDTSEIRSSMGVTGKKGGSKVDSAIVELQRLFYITVAGSRQKIDRKGQPYGWFINIYERAEDWMPREWSISSGSADSGKSMNDCYSTDMDKDEAIDAILEIGIKNGNNINRNMLAKALAFHR